jgi:hypothetical protein
MLTDLAILTPIVVVVGMAVGVVAIVGRRQQRQIGRANQVIPGHPTRAPRSWAVAHNPEALLHRRLRDAMTALRTVQSFDASSAFVLRTDLEQTALDLDDHLVVVAQLKADHKEEYLQAVTATVESIEGAVAKYAAAATLPDTSALEADLATVQRQLDTTAELQRKLPPSYS